MSSHSISVGYMEQLDGKWILVKDTKCPEKDSSPATLGLTNMAGKCNCNYHDHWVVEPTCATAW